MSVRWERNFISFPSIEMTFTFYSDKEMRQAKVIEKYLDKILELSDCVELLQCSERTFYRFLAKYRRLWPPWLVHWLKWKPSNHQWDETKYGFVRNIFHKNSKIRDFWPTLMGEYLQEEFDLTINKETLRQIMINDGLWIPNPRRNKIRHQLRERKSTFWIMRQFDGSYHDWFENGEEWCLLCAVDDATGQVVAKFTKWESFLEVYDFWLEYFKRFGKPEMIYVDSHATYKVNHPQDQRDVEKTTRFQRGMERLGVLVIYSKVPQGKGRVERGNGTHQDRLVKKMRLECIKTVWDANKYLKKYLKQHNEKFAIKARESGDKHQTFTTQDQQNIERYFAKECIRTVKLDGTLQYNNKTYQIMKWVRLKSNKITVKDSIYGNVNLFDWTKELQFTKITKR